MEDLLAKLKELSQGKAKYEKRSFIWVLDEFNRPSHKKIIDHRWGDYEKEYICEITDCTGEPYWITENSLYPTKSQLIEAQIEYWGNLLGEEAGQYAATVALCNEILMAMVAEHD